jgi:hypothetical protein
MALRIDGLRMNKLKRTLHKVHHRYRRIVAFMEGSKSQIGVMVMPHHHAESGPYSPKPAQGLT